MISAIQIADGGLQAQLDHLPTTLRKALEEGLERATNLLRSAVAAMAGSPFGASSATPFGEFAASVRASVSQEGRELSGHVFLAPPADQYGVFVEVGSAPHFPPPAALEGWVRRRLGIAGDRQVREVAFLTGRKIARRGTDGHFFFEHALRENENKVMAILEQAVEGALGRE